MNKIKLYIDGPPLSDLDNIISHLKNIYPDYEVHKANLINYATLHRLLPNAPALKTNETLDKVQKQVATLNTGQNYYFTVKVERNAMYSYMQSDEADDTDIDVINNLHLIQEYHAALSTVYGLNTIEVSENLSFEIPIVLESTIDFVINKRNGDKEWE